MQLSWRSVAPGEIDHELLWLCVSMASLGTAGSWLALGLPWPHCLFHDLTGRPCVTCGMTRSAIQFFHGHLVAALQWNPLVFFALCALSIFNAYSGFVLITGAPRLRFGPFSSAEKMFARATIMIALGLNWIYLLLHWRNF
jgi:hypothetical protein